MDKDTFPPGFQQSLSFAQDTIFGELGLSPNLVAVYLVAIQVVFAFIMLRPDSAAVMRQIPYQAVLTDFGLARAPGESKRLTKTGDIVGTLSYIAPEQVQAAGDVSGRADIYALGIMVYQMLTGNLPFRQENPGALLIAHLTQPPPDPRDFVPDLPDRVVCALERALAKEPEQRYATSEDFARALSSPE